MRCLIIHIKLITLLTFVKLWYMAKKFRVRKIGYYFDHYVFIYCRNKHNYKLARKCMYMRRTNDPNIYGSHPFLPFCTYSFQTCFYPNCKKFKTKQPLQLSLFN